MQLLDRMDLVEYLNWRFVLQGCDCAVRRFAIFSESDGIPQNHLRKRVRLEVGVV